MGRPSTSCTCIGLENKVQVQHYVAGILLAFHPPLSCQVWVRVKCDTLFCNHLFCKCFFPPDFLKSPWRQDLSSYFRRGHLSPRYSQADKGRGWGPRCNDNVFAVSRLVTLGRYPPPQILPSVGNILLNTR